jgi:hypothetical protein
VARHPATACRQRTDRWWVLCGVLWLASAPEKLLDLPEITLLASSPVQRGGDGHAVRAACTFMPGGAGVAACRGSLASSVGGAGGEVGVWEGGAPGCWCHGLPQAAALGCSGPGGVPNDGLKLLGVRAPWAPVGGWDWGGGGVRVGEWSQLKLSK